MSTWTPDNPGAVDFTHATPGAGASSAITGLNGATRLWIRATIRRLTSYTTNHPVWKVGGQSNGLGVLYYSGSDNALIARFWWNGTGSGSFISFTLSPESTAYGWAVVDIIWSAADGALMAWVNGSVAEAKTGQAWTGSFAQTSDYAFEVNQNSYHGWTSGSAAYDEVVLHKMSSASDCPFGTEAAAALGGDLSAANWLPGGTRGGAPYTTFAADHRWKINEGSGATLADDLGSNDITLSGNYAWIAGVSGDWVDVTTTEYRDAPATRVTPQSGQVEIRL